MKTYRPLSSQVDLALHYILFPRKAQDINFISLYYSGADKDALEKAFNKLVETQDAFRARITFGVRGFRERILDYTFETLPVIEVEESASLPDVMQKYRHFKGLLTGGKAYRAYLFHQGEKYTLLLSAHHLIVDGYSIGLIVDQLDSFYNAIIRGEPCVLPPKLCKFEDALREYNAKYTKAYRREIRHYWRHKLDQRDGFGVIMPPTKSRTPIRKAETVVDGEAYQRVKALAGRIGVPVSSIVQSGIALALARTTGKRDFTVMQVNHGRPKFTQKKAVGCFANDFLNFYHVDETQPFEQYLTDSYMDYLEDSRHSDGSLILRALAMWKTELKLFRVNFYGILFSLLDEKSMIRNPEHDYGFLEYHYQFNQAYVNFKDDHESRMAITVTYQSGVTSPERVETVIEELHRVLQEKLPTQAEEERHKDDQHRLPHRGP